MTNDSSYNSAVFGSISSNDYFAFSVSEPFLEDASCRNCTNPINTTATFRRFSDYAESWQSWSLKNAPIVLETLRREYKNGSLDRLEPADCLNQYATTMQSNRRNVLLVASELPKMEENTFISGSHVYWGMPFYSPAASSASDAADAYDWICSGLQESGSCSSLADNIKPSSTAVWTVGRGTTLHL